MLRGLDILDLAKQNKQTKAKVSILHISHRANDRLYQHSKMTKTALLLLTLPALVSGACLNLRNTDQCAALMSGFVLTAEYEAWKHAECFNFCNGQFVNTQMFFLGTTMCSGLPNTMPYVSGCTVASLQAVGQTTTMNVASGSPQGGGTAVTVPSYQTTQVAAGAPQASSATASGQYITDGNGVRFWVSGGASQTTTATVTAPVVQQQQQLTGVQLAGGQQQASSVSYAAGQQQSSVSIVGSTAGPPLVTTIAAPPLVTAANRVVPVTTVVASGAPQVEQLRGSILSATVSGTAGVSTTEIRTANGAPQNVVSTANGSSRIFGGESSSSSSSEGEGKGKGKGKGKRGKGKGGKGKGKRGRTTNASRYEALPNSAAATVVGSPQLLVAAASLVLSLFVAMAAY